MDALVFIALAVALAAGAWWRWQHPGPTVAAGYRAGLWLLGVQGASMVLRLSGIV